MYEAKSNVRSSTIDDEPKRNTRTKRKEIERRALVNRMRNTADVVERYQTLQDAVVPEQRASNARMAHSISSKGQPQQRERDRDTNDNGKCNLAHRLAR